MLVWKQVGPNVWQLTPLPLSNVLIRLFADVWFLHVPGRPVVQLRAVLLEEAQRQALGIFHELLRDTLGAVIQLRRASTAPATAQ